MGTLVKEKNTCVHCKQPIFRYSTSVLWVHQETFQRPCGEAGSGMGDKYANAVIMDESVKSENIRYEAPHCWVVVGRVKNTLDSLVLGVYTDRTRAEACAWRALNDEPDVCKIEIQERVLND